MLAHSQRSRPELRAPWLMVHNSRRRHLAYTPAGVGPRLRAHFNSLPAQDIAEVHFRADALSERTAHGDSWRRADCDDAALVAMSGTTLRALAARLSGCTGALAPSICLLESNCHCDMSRIFLMGGSFLWACPFASAFAHCRNRRVRSLLCGESSAAQSTAGEIFRNLDE